MQNEYYVYIYLDPRKPGIYKYNDFTLFYEPFYVGKGKNRRLYNHLEKKKLLKNTFKNNKIKKILHNGHNLKQYIIKIKNNLSLICSNNLEIKLINEIGRYDLNKGPLTNLTDGGDFGTDGYKHNIEVKKYISRIKRGKINNYRNNICKWCQNEFKPTSSKQFFCKICKEKINYMYKNNIKYLIEKLRCEKITDALKKRNRNYERKCKWCQKGFKTSGTRAFFCKICKEKINYIYQNKVKKLTRSLAVEKCHKKRKHKVIKYKLICKKCRNNFIGASPNKYFCSKCE